jgi:SHS2 domain-containing protein
LVCDNVQITSDPVGVYRRLGVRVGFTDQGAKKAGLVPAEKRNPQEKRIKVKVDAKRTLEMGKYRFLEDTAIADAAFEAEGESLPDLFEACAQATFQVMARITTVAARKKEKIHLESDDLEGLLFNWLAELIYLKDVKTTIFNKYKIKIEKPNGYRLRASVWGEQIDVKKHKVKVDVKAVTYHLLEVKNKNNKWTAKVILDT